METTEPSSQSQKTQFFFSYFNNLWSKESTIITLHDLYQQVTSPLWKPKTESYRKLKDRPDRDNEAKMTKDSMPVVIIEGTCRPHRSHAAANLEKLNGLAMYDMDHSGQRTSEIKNRLRQLPYVAYTHTSISGEGLKIIVYLDVRTPDEYPLAYAICRQTLEQTAGHPCDGQCARITQPCSCVWDIDAYYNPSPTPYPWREELTTDPSLATLVSPSAEAGNSYTYAPGSSTKASSVPPVTEACGYIEAFARTFAHYHPWQKGNRHESMLAMGRSARRKGFSKEELIKLTSVMAVEVVGNGYMLQELRKDLFAGYQYVDLAYILSKEGNELPEPPTATYPPNSTGETAENEEEMSIKNEEIRATAPCIPDEVYARLPDFLKEALKAARTNRERDILLLGVLANLSGCMPNVIVSFDQRPYSTNLYSLVVGPSASGKGLLVLAAKLPEAINNYLKGENKRKKEAYDRELQAWEEGSTRHSKKGGQAAGTPTATTVTPAATVTAYTPTTASTTASSPTPTSKPAEPEYIYLCGAPNTSKSQLIKRLKINGKLGLIINASELDMISGSMKQDYGRHEDVFRAAFHHEPVATDYKVDGEIICAEEPHLSICAGGTPDQLLSFITAFGNGHYERFIIYTTGANWKFRSAAPIKGAEDYSSLYKRLSQQVLDMYLFFLQSPTEVTLTDSQWAEHTAYFGNLLNEVASEQANAPGSIVLRSALIVVRIAAILTGLRKAECAMRMKEYICSDDDFHTAMDIVKTTFEHSLLLASSLPPNKVKPQPLRAYFRMRPVIKALPATFTYKEARDIASKKNISERSVCRYLQRLVEDKYLDKQDNTYRKLKEITAR